MNESFERDIEFRNFIIGVWNMDFKEVPANAHGKKKDSDMMAKNSREQWKMENHKALLGQRTIIAHDGQSEAEQI